MKVQNTVKKSKMMRFVAIIPARFASTRFPGKPLADMNGKFMIQRVYEQVQKGLKQVYVATDDKRIYNAVVSFGGNVIMTSDQHMSGTDRCYEALTKLSEEYDVVINIQGDEPFIQPEQIEELIKCFDAEETEIATLVKPITVKDGENVLFNPNIPKVVINNRNNALYFSRSPIPYFRGKPQNEWLSCHQYFRHIGIYAYRTNVLSRITGLPQSELEIAESLEQLRWLQNGCTIKVGYTNADSIGIDTPEDLERAIKML